MERMMKLPADFKLAPLWVSKASGIYKISSIIDDRFYIGSTCNLYDRYYRHTAELKGNKHCNSRLQNFANKYTVESLLYEVIEYCEINLLLIREQWYLDTLTPSFNIAKIAASRLGIKASPETIKKLSDSHKGFVPSEETRKKLSEAGKGRKMSPEHRERLMEISRNRVRSPEELFRMSENQKGRKYSAESKLKQSIMRSKISPSLAVEIVRLHLDGLSHMKISILLKIGRMCVFNVLNNNGIYSNEYIYSEKNESPLVK